MPSRQTGSLRLLHRKLERAAGVALVAGAIVALLTVTITITSPAEARARSVAAATATDFTLPARTGEVRLAALRGKVVYVDFWASWCGPCRSSFPWMAQLAKSYHERGFEVVAVNLDKDRALADAFLAEHLAKSPEGFTVAFDPAGRTAGSYQVAAMPTSFVIGRDGRVLLRHAGFDARRTDDVVKRIEEALAR